MQEEIREILEKLNVDGEVFNEDTMKEIALFIENKVGEHQNKVEEELKEQYATEMKDFTDDLVEKLDGYVNYFVDQFIKENEEQIEDAVVVKTAKRVVENMNRFVNDFNISLDEGSMRDEDEIQELRESTNRAVNEKIKLTHELNSLKKSNLISEKAQELEYETEREQFKTLAENFEFIDEDDFSEKLDFLEKSINKGDDDNALEDHEETGNYNKKLEESSSKSETEQQIDGYMKYLS